MRECDEILCDQCGAVTVYVECWDCEDGVIDGEALMDEDPLWYGPDDWEPCVTCQGKGGWHVCPQCHPEAAKDAY